MTIILYILLVFTAVVITASALFSQKVLNIKVLNTERIVQLESENGNLDSRALSELSGLDKEELSIPSRFGYALKGWLIRTAEPSDKFMIFSHGITVSRFSSIKYMNLFRKRGWNCILYDHRRHGDTRGKYTTFGFYEKYDLKSVVDWVRESFAGNTLVGIHGESMGSAIALLYAGMEDGADFYIVDCPYSSLGEQLSYRLKAEYRLPRWPIIPLVSLFIKLRAGFTLEQVSPINYIQNIKKPVLFIHSIKDGYIPVKMTQEMYERKKGVKKLFLAEDGGHAMAYRKSKEKYEQVVEEFLSEVL